MSSPTHGPWTITVCDGCNGLVSTTGHAGRCIPATEREVEVVEARKPPAQPGLWKVRSLIRQRAVMEPADAARHIIALEAEVVALREALTEIADGYERHNPGWWIKKAKAALGRHALEQPE